MRSSVFLFVTALLLYGSLAQAASPVARMTAPPVSFSRVGVFFEFETRPAQLAIETMQREVESIMRPAGLTFGWRELGTPDQGSFADLVVVKFKGTCSGVDPLTADSYSVTPGTALASTKTSNGQVLHFTDVYCDEVRRYLSADAAPLDEAGRDLLYGRAFGRILSHEMWHIFAGTEKHASTGIARACFNRKELVQPVLLFDLKEEAVLHQYAMRALLSKEANPEP
ncbi:MAG TPA: hypothetical protein VG273_24290 [Bryobacteraceae bacterium]|jgi:hypothetical protein|nr:hypothetical protein [Bryobacteraceae bacterium]